MEEKEKTVLVPDAEDVVDLEFPTEHVITVFTKFIEHFFNDKDFKSVIDAFEKLADNYASLIN